MDVWMGWMNDSYCGWMDEWMDEKVDRWMDAWVDGLINR